MSKKICLTANQQRAFEFIKKFHKDNGKFPNPTQLADGLGKKKTGANHTLAAQMYGALLLKGAFTDGSQVADSAYERHSGGNIVALNIADLTFTTASATKAKKASKGVNSNALASALLELLKSSPQFNEIAAQLRG